MSIGVHVRIERPEVWDAFREFVRKRHGKIHTVMGQELEQAILSYIDAQSGVSSEPARTHTRDNKTADGARKRRVSNTQPMSPYYAKLLLVQKRMQESGAWDTESFQHGVAMRFIKETCGGDNRTVQRYLGDLEHNWTYKTIQEDCHAWREGIEWPL